MGFQTISQAQLRAFTNAVVRGGNIIQREGSRLFRPFGMTVAHFNVLNLLAEDPAGVRASDISYYLVVDASSMTYTVDQLEKFGWATRKPDPEDRRAIRIVLTPAGKKLHAKALPIYNSALDELARILESEEIAASLPLLARIPEAAMEAVDVVTQAWEANAVAAEKPSKRRAS